MRGGNVSWRVLDANWGCPSWTRSRWGYGEERPANATEAGAAHRWPVPDRAFAHYGSNKKDLDPRLARIGEHPVGNTARVTTAELERVRAAQVAAERGVITKDVGGTAATQLVSAPFGTSKKDLTML